MTPEELSAYIRAHYTCIEAYATGSVGRMASLENARDVLPGLERTCGIMLDQLTRDIKRLCQDTGDFRARELGKYQNSRLRRELEGAINKVLRGRFGSETDQVAPLRCQLAPQVR